MTFTVRHHGATLRMLMLLLGLFAFAQTASATGLPGGCANPAAAAGDMTYSSIANTMVFCDGNNWVSMAGGVSLTVNSSGGGADNLGNHIATQDLNLNGFSINSGVNAAFTGLGNFSTLTTGGLTVTGASSLTTISTSLIQIGSTGAACTTSIAGGIRYGVSNTMEYCNGSAWVPIGSYTSSTLPTLRTRLSSQQTGVTAFTNTKLRLTNISIDTTGAFDKTTNYRYTPKVAGNYLVTAQVACNNYSGTCVSMIYRNGTPYIEGSVVTGTGSWAVSTVATIMPMNGTSDYLELWGLTGGTTFDTGGNGDSELTAFLLTGGDSGGGGGTANPAGSTSDIQFNSGGLLAADTANFTYLPVTGTVSATHISTTTAQFSSGTIVSVYGGAGNMISSGSAIVSTSSAGSITLSTNGTQRMLLGADGSLKINALPNLMGSRLYLTGNDGSNNVWLGISPTASEPTGLFLEVKSTTAGAVDRVAIAPNNTAGLTVVSTGLVYVGQAANPPNSGILIAPNGSMNIGNTAQASGWAFVGFWRSGVAVGSITQNSTNGVLFNTGSDRRVKENITDTREGLQKLMQISVKDFSFRTDPSHSIVNGFIAQDLNKVYPEAVTTNGDDGEVPLNDKSKIWQVDYGRVTPLIVKAVQDLNIKLEADNQNLEADLKALKAANDNLVKRLKALELQIRDLKPRSR